MTGGRASPAGQATGEPDTPMPAAASRQSSRRSDAVDRYAVIGNPVAHSKSPLIHDAFARATGQRMRYERLLAPLDGFVATVRAFAEANGLGLNVTIPFKLQAFALAREHSAARASGAARATRWRGAATTGSATTPTAPDWCANSSATSARRSPAGSCWCSAPEGRRTASSGPCSPNSRGDWSSPTARTRKAVELAARFERDGPISAEPLAVARGAAIRHRRQCDQPRTGHAVPPGLWPHRLFAPQALAYDLIYADQTTPFLALGARAKARARTADGLGMLIEQAAESFYLWRGVRPDTGPVFRLLRAAGRG